MIFLLFLFMIVWFAAVLKGDDGYYRLSKSEWIKHSCEQNESFKDGEIIYRER